eukprot:4517701-Pleurochrysis_carterae.AAC.1
MRAAFSLTYDSDSDRYYHRIFLEFGKAGYFRMLEPVPPKSRWRLVWHDVKKQLHIGLNDDGSIASRRFLTTVQEMLAEHIEKGMVRSDAGSSSDKPIDL